MSRQSTAHRRPPIHFCPSRSSHNPVRPAPRVCAWLCTPVHACVHECACARARGGEVAASPDWSGCGPWVPWAGTVGFPPSLFQSGKNGSWLRKLLVLVLPMAAPWVGWGAELWRPQKVFGTPRRESARKKRAPSPAFPGPSSAAAFASCHSRGRRGTTCSQTGSRRLAASATGSGLKPTPVKTRLPAV